MKDVIATSNPHRTAIHRKGMSRPARWLQSAGLIKGRVLDYGCGFGEDAQQLQCERYDPYYAPTPPTGLYDTVLCTYVLNVLQLAEQDEVIGRVRKLLVPNGHAYFTVRRDIKEAYTTERGNYQTPVWLSLPVIREWSDRAIYDAPSVTYELRK